MLPETEVIDLYFCSR